jgi:copper oxidase (laccase) domain-containing protein
VHAGWRGTVAEIARRGIEALLGLGAERSTLVAAMGPHICPDCFEVGEEVAAQFEGLGAVVRRAEWPRPHVDLYAANRALLLAAEVRADAIDERPACTHHEPERFFSFRRDGGQIGQQLSFIVAGR